MTQKNQMWRKYFLAVTLKLFSCNAKAFQLWRKKIRCDAKNIFSAVTERGVRLSVIHTNDHTQDERYDTIDLMKLAPDQVRISWTFYTRNLQCY